MVIARFVASEKRYENQKSTPTRRISAKPNTPAVVNSKISSTSTRKPNKDVPNKVTAMEAIAQK